MNFHPFRILLLGAAVPLLTFSPPSATTHPQRSTPQNQELEVTCVKWQPGTDELKASSVMDFKISAQDVETLRALGLKGAISPSSSGVYGVKAGGTGESLRAYALIVIKEPLKRSVTFKQPDGTRVTYLQTEDGWKMYPADARVLYRYIRLFPDPNEPERATRYMVDNADGSRQGGTLVSW